MTNAKSTSEEKDCRTEECRISLHILKDRGIFRNRCRTVFNVTEYYELVKNDPDKEKEISLAIIMNTAKDVKYTTAFGANNLIVRI